MRFTWAMRIRQIVIIMNAGDKQNVQCSYNRNDGDKEFVIVSTSLILEMTRANGDSGTGARLFWLRFRTSVPP